MLEIESNLFGNINAPFRQTSVDDTHYAAKKKSERNVSKLLTEGITNRRGTNLTPELGHKSWPCIFFVKKRRRLEGVRRDL